MRVRIDRRLDGFTVEVDRPPMKAGRFRALCALVAVGVYAGMVVAVTALCGLVGLIVVGAVTFVVGVVQN